MTSKSIAARMFASFFYVGFVPVAPGTFGSLAAFALYYPLILLNDWRIYFGITLMVCVLGIWSAGRAEVDSGSVDPGFIVIDEVSGQLITLFLHPFSWQTAVAAFFIFRGLDVLKPFPARRAEKLHGGWGIMLDDIIVGVYGNLLLWLGAYLIRQL